MAASEQRESPYEFPVDPPIPEMLPPTASVHEVEPLHYFSCLRFYREDIPRYIEQPLVEACRILYDKNVPTTLTSANREDIAYGAVTMFIDYGSLTPANREIACELGSVRRVPNSPRSIVQIEIPIAADSTVGSVSADAVAIAERFEEQPPSTSIDPEYGLEPDAFY